MLLHLFVPMVNSIKFLHNVGVMGVSNTNFALKLFINEDFPKVKDFIARYYGLHWWCMPYYFLKVRLYLIIVNSRLEPCDSSSSQQLTPLIGEQPYSMKEDFLC